MNIRKPEIGDRLVISNPQCEPDRLATVIAKRETRWGIDWEVQFEGDPKRIDTITSYVGTAEDRGGYARILNHGGIGAYLVLRRNHVSDETYEKWLPFMEANERVKVRR